MMTLSDICKKEEPQISVGLYYQSLSSELIRRQSENVVQPSKHRGYIEVSRRSVFVESCVCLARLSLWVHACDGVHALTVFSEILGLNSITCNVKEDDYIPGGQLYLHGDA